MFLSSASYLNLLSGIESSLHPFLRPNINDELA